VRLFEHVVDSLARGVQPDRSRIRETGYLMRTTAVYGNGKFGIADRLRYAERPALAAPFQAEMLTVWLIRGFTLDLVEHVARAKGGARAVPLAPEIRRYLGIGNSTGLGMAPFLVNHPDLLHNWIAARETALARVRAVETATPDRVGRFLAVFAQARRHVADWQVADPRLSARIDILRSELTGIASWLDAAWIGQAARPWDRVFEALSPTSLECQELFVSLLLEPYGDLVDDLADAMAAGEAPRLDASGRAADLRARIEADCALGPRPRLQRSGDGGAVLVCLRGEERTPAGGARR
jgi:hypothetical protein